jgi:uncharacterized membrane protein YphA (DoxX/SURF4 family)
MFRSLQTSHLILRIGLAAVFLWLGAEKILSPDVWASEWLSVAVRDSVRGLGMSPRDPVLLAAILEVLVGISLVSGYFIRVFAGIGVVLLMLGALVQGISIGMMSYVGLISALVALMVWPERTGWQT